MDDLPYCRWVVHAVEGPYVSLLGGLGFRLAVCRVALIRHLGPRIFRHIGIGILTPSFFPARQ
jgi:hypothetical protein